MRVVLGSTGRRSKRSWYIRIALYAAFLGLVFYLVNGMRGYIPQAFGLTPIRVKVLSLSELPFTDSTRPMRDYGVSIRITAQDSIYRNLRMNQFRLLTKDGHDYRPVGSTLVFGLDGTLTIARTDTLRGVLIFSLPVSEKPEEFWWEP